MKTKRHNAIITIINEMDIKTHDQLVGELNKRGYNVTQATISRDIKELGLVKITKPGKGSVYALGGSPSAGRKTTALFATSVIKVDYAGNMAVIKTYPGMASGVAASLDSVFHEKIMGSIAGDDTIFVMTRNEETAAGICREIGIMTQ